MSTKIYEAYKLKTGVDLFEFLFDVKRKARAEMREILTDILRAWHTEPSLQEGVRKRLNLRDDVKFDYFDCYSYLRTFYGEQLTKVEHHHFCLNTSLVVWKVRNAFYMIPYANGLFSRTLDFLKNDPRLDDYSYWNNSDRPEDVSEEEWDARYDLWNILFDRWLENIVLEICTYDSFGEISPHSDLMQEGIDKEKC